MRRAGGSEQQPFFIVGSDRSGTTLLRLYLDANSRLAVPSESWFLIDLFAAFGPGAGRHDGPGFPAGAAPGQGRVLTAAELERAVELVTNHPRFSDGWHVDPDALREDLARVSHPTLADFIDTLYRLETGVGADGRWGDKTPEYALHMTDIARTFPLAQFIHIVRDGRDVYLSLASKRWSDRGHTPYELGRYWSRAVGTATAAGERLGPQRYLLIRYEDLVLDTRATLMGVTEFLGVGFEEHMLGAHSEAGKIVTASESAAGVHDKLFRAPRRSDVARWREAPGDRGVVLAAGVMAHELRVHGYPDVPAQPVAFVTRNLAAYHHAWRRYLRPRLKRLVAKVRGGTSQR